MADSPDHQALSRDDVAHVAKLAMLDLTDEEIDLFTVQLGDVLVTADAMNAVDLGDIEPFHHPMGLVNVFRPDVVVPSLDRDEVLSQAPEVEENRFRVPPALGEES
jgi:aspartyl-tRNA(Asn)/glutamyl-tRNA(Gln) amidotransferase subunit C